MRFFHFMTCAIMMGVLCASGYAPIPQVSDTRAAIKQGKVSTPAQGTQKDIKKNHAQPSKSLLQKIADSAVNVAEKILSTLISDNSECGNIKIEEKNGAKAPAAHSRRTKPSAPSDEEFRTIPWPSERLIILEEGDDVDVFQDLLSGKLLLGHADHFLTAAVRSMLLPGPQVFATFFNPYVLRDLTEHTFVDALFVLQDKNNKKCVSIRPGSVKHIARGARIFTASMMLLGLWNAWSHGFWSSATALVASTAHSYLAPQIARIIPPVRDFLKRTFGFGFALDVPRDRLVKMGPSYKGPFYENQHGYCCE